MCGAFFHHSPDLAWRIRSSDRLDRLIIALRRTPPTTTISPILHIRLWHSYDDSLRPFATLKVSIVKLNKSTSGAGPLARPPNVFRRAPAGRTLLTSQVGISPAYNIEISRRYAFAQPSLLSRTTIVVSLSNSCSGISGRCLIY